jgi:hypothetical protein
MTGNLQMSEFQNIKCKNQSGNTLSSKNVNGHDLYIWNDTNKNYVIN